MAESRPENIKQSKGNAGFYKSSAVIFPLQSAHLLHTWRYQFGCWCTLACFFDKLVPHVWDLICVNKPYPFAVANISSHPGPFVKLVPHVWDPICVNKPYLFIVANISCSSLLNKTQDLIPFTQYYCVNGLAEGAPKKITQRIFRPWGVTEHASWSLSVPWYTKRNEAFTLQPFPWHTSDLQGKGLTTKGKAFLSSKQAYLCTIIKLELQAMGVATTTIFQDSDSCNYFLNQAVDVKRAGTFPWWDWPWSNTKTEQIADFCWKVLLKLRGWSEPSYKLLDQLIVLLQSLHVRRTGTLSIDVKLVLLQGNI